MGLIMTASVRQVVLASQVCYLSHVTLNFLSLSDHKMAALHQKHQWGFFKFFFIASIAILFPNKKRSLEDKD